MRMCIYIYIYTMYHDNISILHIYTHTYTLLCLFRCPCCLCTSLSHWSRNGTAGRPRRRQRCSGVYIRDESFRDGIGCDEQIWIHSCILRHINSNRYDRGLALSSLNNPHSHTPQVWHTWFRLEAAFPRSTSSAVHDMRTTSSKHIPST